MRKFYLTKIETVFFHGVKKPALSKATGWPLFLLLILILMGGGAEAQAPALSYPGPKTYQQGKPVSLAPTSSGVAAFGYSTTATPYGSGFKDPLSVAADAAGNVYVTDFYSNNVVEIPAGNGTPVNPGLGDAGCVQIDAAGNIYLTGPVYYGSGNAGFFMSDLYERPAGSNTLIQLDKDDLASTIAIDPAGDIFSVDNDGMGDNVLEEWPAGSHSGKILSADYGGNSFGGSLACDAAGDVFYSVPTYIIEIPAGNGAPITLSGTFPDPIGMTFDAAGNMFTVDAVSHQLTMNRHGNINGSPVPLGPQFANPVGITVDGLGNIYVSSFTENPTPGFISQVKPTGGYFITPALPAGLSFDNNTGIISGTPTTVSAATNYTITAYNSGGSTSTAVSIQISGSSHDADLAALKPNRGVVSPTFLPAITNYTATVTNGVTSLQVTPVTASPGATVTINGVPVADSAASAPIPVAIGSDTIRVVVTSADRLTTESYTLAVNRPGNSDDDLSALKLNPGSLSPVFTPVTTSYTVNVANGVRSMTVTSTADDPDEKILVNGVNVASGAASAPIALAVGSTTIKVLCIASNDTPAKTYTITVNRPASSNDNLSSLNLSAGTLSPVYVASTTAYTVNELNAQRSIMVTPTAGDPDATIKVNGTIVASGTASAPIALPVGSSTISIGVTASDGTTAKTYGITVNRPPSSNDSLSYITLSTGPISPAFTPATTSYGASVLYQKTSTTVTPTASDPDATITVNGATVASGSASGAIPLSVGSNAVNIAVTASDGTTSQTYTVTVTRDTSLTNDELSYLSFTAGVLSPAFVPTTTSYTVNNESGGPLTDIGLVAADSNATVTINGVTTPSRGNSPIFSLSAGSNIFNIIVTASDGTTSKTYTVNVIRPPSNNANLSSLKISRGALSPVFTSANTSYTASVVNGVSSVTITPTITYNSGATVAVNGTVVASGTASDPITLNVGSNTITTVVTAQDGVTTNTYTIVFTRAAPALNTPDASLSVTGPVEKPTIEDDAIVVHQGVSPNGDGINDFLVIDGIQAYPDNKLFIMNWNGQLIFEAKGYDNSSKVFDGHSNKNGQMQLPGTYFYELDYTVSGIIKHKTGYLVLKY